MSKLNFNAATVAPESRPEPIPAGWYNLQIIESEQKPTQSGGVRLAAVLAVLDGQYAGRKIFDNMNIVNSNPVAQEIALGRLSAYCHATETINITDTTQLHGKPFKGKVAIRPAKDGYDAQNEIKAVKHIRDIIDGAPAPTVGGAPAANVPSWATAGAVAPAPVAAAAPAPVAAAPVAPAPVPVPAPVAAAPVKTMTPKANGASYETFISSGWKEEDMIAQGYMVVSTPAPVAAPAPAPAPVAPAPVMPTAAGAAPPWVK